MNHLCKVSLSVLSASVLLCSCASTPMGPTIPVMPGATIPFPIFQKDQEECKQYAQTQVAGQADAANKAAVGSALLGTALGAVLGAAVGNSQGAGVGAAIGATAGTGIGAGNSQGTQGSIQDQYNNAYAQCMYSKGNQIPGAPTADAPPPPPPPAPVAAQMTVAQAQTKLNALGFPVGAPDGSMGARTHQALRHFQHSRSLPETGELDSTTVAALSQ